MIEESRDGLETAQQLQAVVSALDKTKTLLVADHIEHHLEDVVGPLSREARQKPSRLTDIAKYLYGKQLERKSNLISRARTARHQTG